jgi:hypothetical protein
VDDTHQKMFWFVRWHAIQDELLLVSVWPVRGLQAYLLKTWLLMAAASLKKRECHHQLLEMTKHRGEVNWCQKVKAG